MQSAKKKVFEKCGIKSNIDGVCTCRYSLIRIHQKTEADWTMLQQWNNKRELHLWKVSGGTERLISMIASPNVLNELKQFLKSKHFKYEIAVNNLEE